MSWLSVRSILNPLVFDGDDEFGFVDFEISLLNVQEISAHAKRQVLDGVETFLDVPGSRKV